MNEFIKRNLEKVVENNKIDPKYYQTYNVKRGLRNDNGTGVLVGLSQVSNVVGYDIVNDQKVNMPGKLYYRGYDVCEIAHAIFHEDRFGFEETMYLLIFGELPSQDEYDMFKNILGKYRTLPETFTENIILKNPSNDVMNKLMYSILALYPYDEEPENICVSNILNESLRLIAMFPTIVAYSYQAKRHYFHNESLVIHKPNPDLSTAEYLLYLVRDDKKYTKKEVEVLDVCMLLHADHGSNNSNFTTHVVSSTGTDLYSTISAAVGSLKGPKHGGANANVKRMIDDIESNCNYKDLKALKKYLEQILDKKVFDEKGIIYGMGHAVYTLSDPRAEILKKKAYELAVEKGTVDKYALYEHIEMLTKEIFMERKDKPICANVDFYSGFVYAMLNIPIELYTPIFAISRVAGWVAHRIEQITSDTKILRPAYQSVSDFKSYIPIKKR